MISYNHQDGSKCIALERQPGSNEKLDIFNQVMQSGRSKRGKFNSNRGKSPGKKSDGNVSQDADLTKM